MSICGKLNTGVAFDCDNKSTGGLEQLIYLANRSDIDLDTTVVNRDGTTGVHNVSALALLPSAKIYAFEGITGKTILSAGYTKEVGDYIDTSIHTVNVAVYDQCEASLSMLNQFLNGADVVAIVENLDKGASNACAFNIYGFHKGLKAGEINYNSNENNGIVLLPLSSIAPSTEPYLPYSYSETGGYTPTVTYLNSLI